MEKQGEWGARRVREGWGRAPSAPLPPLPIAEPMVPNTYAVKRAVGAWKQFEGSPAQAYARQRGVPDDLAGALRLGYWQGEWQDVDSEWLTFPLRCPVTGKPVGVSGRNLRSDTPKEKSRHLGPRGLFGSAKPDGIPEDVVIVEGPFEALAVLASPGLPPARSLMGASARPEWFDECRRVLLFLDDDEPGHEAADRLVEELNARRIRRQRGPRILCLRPDALVERHGCKDLGELLARGIPVKLELPMPRFETLPRLDPEELPEEPIPTACVAIDWTLPTVGALVQAARDRNAVIEIRSGMLHVANEAALPMDLAAELRRRAGVIALWLGAAAGGEADEQIEVEEDDEGALFVFDDPQDVELSPWR